MGDTPSSADHSGLAGGPAGSGQAMLGPAPTSNPRYLARLVTYRRADGLLVTAMRSVPNPADLSPEDRRSIYGTRYAPRAFLAGGHGRRHVETAVQPASRVVAQAPARPAAPKPLTVTKVAPPVAVAIAPPPKVVEQPKPAAAPTTEVAVLKTPPAAGAPSLKAPADPKLAALQTAISPGATSGSRLTVPDPLPPGQASQVSLSLPQTLLADLQRAAAKLGLGKAAKKVDVTATLSGPGYEITPNGPQTAHLKSGEAPAFNWQVKPGPGEKGALRTDVDATLKGLRLPMSFSLASLEQAVKAALPPQAPAAKGSWTDVLTVPGVKDVEIPGLGRVPSKSLVGAALVLLALLILVSMARNAGGRAEREERRRKFRTMTDYGSKPMASTFDDEPYTPQMSPPIAAATTETPMAAAADVAAAEAPVAPAEAHAEQVIQAESVAHRDLTAPAGLGPSGAATEDDYGLSQIVREGKSGPDAHRELERT